MLPPEALLTRYALLRPAVLVGTVTVGVCALVSPRLSSQVPTTTITLPAAASIVGVRLIVSESG